MQDIVTPEEMGEIDAAAPEPVEVLVGRAGAAVAREALRINGRMADGGAWPTTTSIAWTHATRPGDAS